MSTPPKPMKIKKNRVFKVTTIDPPLEHTKDLIVHVKTKKITPPKQKKNRFKVTVKVDAPDWMTFKPRKITPPKPDIPTKPSKPRRFFKVSDKDPNASGWMTLKINKKSSPKTRKVTPPKSSPNK